MNKVQTLIVFSCGALLLYATKLPAESAATHKPQCFSIGVRLNGQPIDGPQNITLKTKLIENGTTSENGCFKIPGTLLAEKEVDVFFTVAGNKIYLPGISTGFLAGPWDIDLEDKKFGSDVSLPKNASVRRACAVVFHVGEPETALTVTGCRTPLSETTKNRITEK